MKQMVKDTLSFILEPIFQFFQHNRKARKTHVFYLKRMHFALAREMVESLELWLANMAQWKIQVKSILKWAKSKASSVFWLARIPLRELHLAAAAAEKMHSRNHRSPTPALGKKIRKNSEEIHIRITGVWWYILCHLDRSQTLRGNDESCD